MKLSMNTLVAAALMAASASGNEVVPSDHLVSKTEKIMYSCTYSSSWSSANHPVDYPSDAHNSPPVFVSHNANYKMFTPGSPAGPGVAMVAGAGDNTKLGEELVAAGADVMSYIVGSPMFFEAQPDAARRLRSLAEDDKKGGEPITAREQTLPDKLIFTPEHTMFSSITMMAPSPDWFSSSHGTEPILENGDGDKVWLKSFKIETLPYDAGIDSGTTFASEDAATTPAEGVAQFTTDTSDIGIFQNTAMDAVPPVAAWACIIDSVMYKCEFDDDCKEGEDKDKSAANNNSKTFVGAFVSAVMAGAYLFL